MASAAISELNLRCCGWCKSERAHETNRPAHLHDLFHKKVLHWTHQRIVSSLNSRASCPGCQTVYAFWVGKCVWVSVISVSVAQNMRRVPIQSFQICTRWDHTHSPPARIMQRASFERANFSLGRWIGAGLFVCDLEICISRLAASCSYTMCVTGISKW